MTREDSALFGDTSKHDAHSWLRSDDLRVTRPRGRVEIGSKTVQETGSGTLHGSINVLEKPETQMRIFDARELTVMFYGEKYPLRPVVTAIQALQNTIQQVARQRLEAKKQAREGRQ